MKKRFINKSKLFIALAATLIVITTAIWQSDLIFKNSPITSYEKGSLSSVQKEFDNYLDELFKKEVSETTIDLHYSLSNPSAYGIKNPPITFGNYSIEDIKNDYKDQEIIKEKLNSINYKLLTKDQQLTYKILKSYIDTNLLGKGLELYNEPLAPKIGIQAQLPILLAEYEFYERKDVEDYLKLLSQIDSYYEEIIKFQQEKSKAGLFMKDSIAESIIKSCRDYLNLPEKNWLTDSFEECLEKVKGITEKEKLSYIESNKKILKEDFKRAYKVLIDGLTSLKGTGVNELGVSNYKDGKKYYEYLIKKNSGTHYKSVDKLRSAIETQLNKDMDDMTEIIKKYPSIESQLSEYSFSITKPEEILADLEKQISKDFPSLPDYKCDIKYVSKSLEDVLSPAFYIVPPMDRWQENIIYINNGKGNGTDSESLYTVMGHEGAPGHLYQNVYFNNKNTNKLRSLLDFNGYSEGWGSYAEFYTYTLDNGLPKGIGEFLMYNQSATLAIHALLDININYYGYDKKKVADFLSNYYEVTDDLVNEFYDSCIGSRANYVAYYAGYLEFTNMKSEASKELKEKFNLKEFHRFILDIGPAPFDVIREDFKEWLKEAK